MSSAADMPVKAEKSGLSPPEMTQGPGDGIRGVADTQAFGIDDNVIIQGILDVLVEVFFYKCLAIRFRFQKPFKQSFGFQEKYAVASLYRNQMRSP